MSLSTESTATLALIFAALEAGGITSVEASYSGSGDDGSMNDTVFFKDLDQISLPKLASETFKTLSYAALASKPVVTDQTAALHVKGGIYFKTVGTLDDAIEDLTFALIDAGGHSGWENNEGGEGTVIFDVAKKTVCLDHSDFYIKSEQTSTSWAANGTVLVDQDTAVEDTPVLIAQA
jgi:hypothetical protein